MPLTRERIKELRGQAHSLAPVVRVGEAGLSEGVLRAIDDALTSHELVKVRMLSDNRTERSAWIDEIQLRTRSEKVLAVGKMLTVWRKRPPKKSGTR